MDWQTTHQKHLWGAFQTLIQVDVEAKGVNKWCQHFWTLKMANESVLARRGNDIPNDPEKSLFTCKRNVRISAYMLWLCALHKCAYRSLIALLETLHCLYGDPTSFLLNVYANAELRRTLILCACSNCATLHGVLDDPTATNKDTVALLRRYKRLYLRISEERSRIIDLGSEMTVCARNQTTVHTSNTLWTRSGNPNNAISTQFERIQLSWRFPIKFYFFLR